MFLFKKTVPVRAMRACSQIVGRSLFPLKKTVPDIACQSLCVNKKFDII